MQVTVNVISLPSVIVDAYLDILGQSIEPIFAEDTLSAEAQEALMLAAYFASAKSLCMKFEKELEDAGLFKGVISIDHPGFKWTRGLKFCYAVDMIMTCIVKTMAEEMVTGRDVSAFLDFLSAWRTIRIDRATDKLLEHVDAPAVRRRLEDHALGLSTGNESLMVGETPTMMERVLLNVKDRLRDKAENPLECLQYDLEYLSPSVITHI